jgi:hypothetical protein
MSYQNQVLNVTTKNDCRIVTRISEARVDNKATVAEQIEVL